MRGKMNFNNYIVKVYPKNLKVNIHFPGKFTERCLFIVFAIPGSIQVKS